VTIDVSFRDPDEVKRLASAGKLSWRGKKLLLDPYTKIDFFYEIEPQGEEFLLRGKLSIGSMTSPLEEADAITPLGPIHHQLLRLFPEHLSLEEVVYVYPQPKRLSALELHRWLPTAIHRVVWKGGEVKLVPDPLPRLVLDDATGGFATLWMDYGPFGKTKAGEALSPEEQYWERDLLETGFVKKSVGISHYYCPLDRAVRTIRFLLDLGWTVVDVQGRQVAAQRAWNVESLPEEGDDVTLSGEVTYGNRRVPLVRWLGALEKGEKLIDLGGGEMGLVEEIPPLQALRGEKITSRGVSVSRAIATLIPEAHAVAALEERPPTADFCGTLYPYQQHGVNFLSLLSRSRLHGLLADEMGLGKTVQLLAFFSQLLPLERPICIVMPRSLLFQWKREWERFLPKVSVYLHVGEERVKEAAWLERQSVILISYATLRLDAAIFEQLHFRALVLDEAQAIKNSRALTTDVVCSLKSDFRVAVTGTPIENSLDDLASIFHFLLPKLLEARSSPWTAIEVKGRVRPFLLRRRKADVLLDLPPKMEQTVWIDLSLEEREVYDKLLAERRGQLRAELSAKGIQGSRSLILETILRLRQLCCHGRLVTPQAPEHGAKLAQVVDDLASLIAGGHKVLIYSQFTSMLERIAVEVERNGWGYVVLDGSTKDRETPVRRFQDDPQVALFLLSLKAGGVGLNLTAANYVVLFDPWWNIAAEAQAIDRAHRLGQKQVVTARRYLTVGTIEEKISILQEKKRSLAEAVLDGEDPADGLSLEELCAAILE
jgi:superfamily II DNA or RNA helicase